MKLIAYVRSGAWAHRWSLRHRTDVDILRQSPVPAGPGADGRRKPPATRAPVVGDSGASPCKPAGALVVVLAQASAAGVVNWPRPAAPALPRVWKLALKLKLEEATLSRLRRLCRLRRLRRLRRLQRLRCLRLPQDSCGLTREGQQRPGVRAWRTLLATSEGAT